MACLLKYNNKGNKLDIINNSSILFKEKIYSISNSKENQKIYACLYYERNIKVFKYNTKTDLLKICDEEIKTNSSEKLYKFIPLFNDYVATSDNKGIRIWKKRNNKVKYSLIKRIVLNEKIFDIILYEYKLLIFSKNNGIGFSKLFPNFEMDKIINKIDIIDSIDGLLLNKDYIFDNCKGGIAMIFVKTKELVQYILNDSNNKILCKINKDNLCMVIVNHYHYIKAIILQYLEGILKETEEIKVDNKDELEVNSITNFIHICLIDEMKVIIAGYYTHFLLELN